jgi:hypothetical protein
VLKTDTPQSPHGRPSGHARQGSNVRTNVISSFISSSSPSAHARATVALASFCRGILSQPSFAMAAALSLNNSLRLSPAALSDEFNTFQLQLFSGCPFGCLQAWASYGQRSHVAASQARCSLLGRPPGWTLLGFRASTWADLVSLGSSVSQISVTNQISVRQEVICGRQLRDRRHRTKEPVLFDGCRIANPELLDFGES